VVRCGVAVATLFEYLADETERPLLVQALSRTLTDEERERYAAVIAGRDPARAEWLRLERVLHAQAGDAASRRRFDELCAALSADWLRVMSRDALLNCGQARGQPRRVRFTFVCERRWESLAPTGEPTVRACEGCGEQVHRCESVREAEEHATRGHCNAVPGELVAKVDGYDARHVLGRPDPLGNWAARLFRDE
jgi:hypothetical protein